MNRDETDVEVRRDVRIPTKDPGVTLSADIYLPMTTRQIPAAALVTVTPYRKDLFAGLQYDSTLRYFARHGYACLLVDLRGCGSSDGVVRGRLDPAEGDDSVAAIGWAAAQSWCTGRVGMWGASYDGAMTLRAASLRPPALRAIMPIVAKPDPERYDGARGDFGIYGGWGSQQLALQLMPPLHHPVSPTDRRRWQERLSRPPLLLDLTAHGRGEQHWRNRCIDPAEITAPTFCIGGWRDAFPGPVIDTYEQVRGPKKLLMGPWMHSLPNAAPFHPIDFPAIALRWWDYWLRDADNGISDEPPVTLYTLNAGRPVWRTYDRWPPRCAARSLTTHQDATLRATTQGDPGPAHVIAHYRPDPTSGPLSGLGGESVGIGLPLDQHDDDQRGVTATSDPLLDDVTICGRPTVQVDLGRPDPGVDASPVKRLIARLAEVDPAGRSFMITDGRLIPTHGSQALLVTLQPTMFHVARGRRLRVVVTDADFPRLTPLIDGPEFDVLRVVLTLPILDPRDGTEIEIPSLDAANRTSETWTITRDPVLDAVEVTLGSTGHTPTVDGQHELETRRRSSAFVRREDPGGCLVTGMHVLTAVHLDTGTRLAVETSIRSTQTSLRVQGSVEKDGLPLFTKSWDAALGSTYPPGGRTFRAPNRDR